MRRAALTRIIGSQGSIPSPVQLLAEMGYTIYATSGTASFIAAAARSASQPVNVVSVHDAKTKEEPNVLSLIAHKAVKYVFNTPSSRDSQAATAGYQLRRKALDGGAALVFDFRVAIMLVDALYHKWTVEKSGGEFWMIESWQECHRIG